MVCIGAPRTESSLRMLEHLPRLAGSVPANAAQDALSIFAMRPYWLFHGQLIAHQDLKVIFCRAAFLLAGQPPVHIGLWGYSPTHFPMNSVRFLMTPTSSLLKSHNHLLYQSFRLFLYHLHTCQGCPQSHQPGHWRRCYTVLAPIWGPLGAPLATGLQRGIMLLVTILTVQPAFKPPHCPFVSSIFHQFVYKDVLGDSAESLIKTGINNTHCTPLIHRVTHLIVEGYHNGQAWFQHISDSPECEVLRNWRKGTAPLLSLAFVFIIVGGKLVV